MEYLYTKIYFDDKLIVVVSNLKLKLKTRSYLMLFMVGCRSNYIRMQKKHRTFVEIPEKRFSFKQNFNAKSFLKEKMHYSLKTSTNFLKI